jgi:hypothetical protein
MDLRHKFNKANSYAKACEQVENMEKEFITLISKNLCEYRANYNMNAYIPNTGS